SNRGSAPAFGAAWSPDCPSRPNGAAATNTAAPNSRRAAPNEWRYTLGIGLSPPGRFQRSRLAGGGRLPIRTRRNGKGKLVNGDPRPGLALHEQRRHEADQAGFGRQRGIGAGRKYQVNHAPRRPELLPVDRSSNLVAPLDDLPVTCVSGLVRRGGRIS